jgi:hypothetical protein
MAKDPNRDISKYSIASKNRWAKYSTEDRTKRMRALALSRWDKSTKKERKEHSKKMVLARKPKVEVSK